MANRRKDKKLARVTISVDPDDYASMEKLARKSSLSTARMIRQAMREFLERQQKETTLNITLENQTIKDRETE